MTTKKNHRWIWFFVVVAGLSLAAVVSLIVYNLGQQLKPEQLEAAIRLWKEKGWRSYQLTYTIKRGIPASTDTYVVRVRGGRVVSSTVNDRPEEKRLFGARGMDALFDDIERFRELDAKPGRPRTYTRAIFDNDTGALRWYVRSVMGVADSVFGAAITKERTEIKIESLEPLEMEMKHEK
jgi:hypothetical protein